jgi:hypothetical protein
MQRQVAYRHMDCTARENLFGLVSARKNLGFNFSEEGGPKNDTLFFTLDTETGFVQFEEESHDSSIHTNYLCTYDLYGPVCNVFDAGR